MITITNIKDTSKGFTIYYYTIGGLEFPYMKTDNYLNNKIIILKNEKPDNTSNNTNTNGTIPVVVPVESNNITNSSVPGNTNNSNNNNNKNSSNSGIYMKIGMIESLIIAITLILINY